MEPEIVCRQVRRAAERAAAKRERRAAKPVRASQPAYRHLIVAAQAPDCGAFESDAERTIASRRILQMNRRGVRRAYVVAKRRGWSGDQLLRDLAEPVSLALAPTHSVTR